MYPIFHIPANSLTLSWGPSDLRVTTLPHPKPSPTQYLVAIHASATNFYDLLQIQGKYQHQPPLPWISGSEFAGVVLSVPSHPRWGQMPKFKAGDRVFGASQGGYATHICAEEANLRLVPEDWDFMSAAGLYITAPTSYAGLVTRANIKKGDWVLVHAAAGGVGLAAVQIAKAFGATVIATAGTKRKREVARDFGADYCVDYTKAKWEDEVKRLTPNGRGVDIIYDPVGMVDKSLKCIAWNGRVVVVGFAAGAIEKIAMNRVLLKNVSLVGVHWGMYSKMEPDVVEEVWEAIGKLIEEGKFRATVFTDKEFVGLENVPEALKTLAGRGSWGKVVVKVPQDGESKL
jgi:NADPH:quinone reductase